MLPRIWETCLCLLYISQNLEILLVMEVAPPRKILLWLILLQCLFTFICFPKMKTLMKGYFEIGSKLCIINNAGYFVNLTKIFEFEFSLCISVVDRLNSMYGREDPAGEEGSLNLFDNSGSFL